MVVVEPAMLLASTARASSRVLGVCEAHLKSVALPCPSWQIVQANVCIGCGLESLTNRSSRGCEVYGLGRPRRTVSVIGLPSSASSEQHRADARPGRGRRRCNSRCH